MTKPTTPKAPAKTPVKTSATTSAKKPIAKARVIEKTEEDIATAMEAKPDVEMRTEISKKELIERIVEQSDMKKGDARRAADATLLALASVLRSGADIAAAPLGKIKITKQKATSNGDLVVCRIKLKSLD